MWGAEDAGELKEILANDYIAKFVATTLEYKGDLFVVQSDTLDADIPANALVSGTRRTACCFTIKYQNFAVWRADLGEII
jgi:hypothetical protein